jgi:predicted ABC-type ATPase
VEHDAPGLKPLVVIIAGPNGAGKSTAAPRLLQGPLEVDEFVNADTIARGLSAFHPESVAVTAGRMMLQRLRLLAAARADFAFETTLAGRNFAPWLNQLRTSSVYRAHLIFLSLPSPDLAIARVSERVRLGGHYVDEATVRRRFAAGLRNLFTLYQGAVDTWQLLDNTNLAAPATIAFGHTGQPATIVDTPAWRRLTEQQR